MSPFTNNWKYRWTEHRFHAEIVTDTTTGNSKHSTVAEYRHFNKIWQCSTSFMGPIIVCSEIYRGSPFTKLTFMSPLNISMKISTTGQRFKLILWGWEFEDIKGVIRSCKSQKETKRLTIIQKTLYRTQKTEQHNPHYIPEASGNKDDLHRHYYFARTFIVYAYVTNMYLLAYPKRLHIKHGERKILVLCSQIKQLIVASL
jgi:hypothetical protein